MRVHSTDRAQAPRRTEDVKPDISCVVCCVWIERRPITIHTHASFTALLGHLQCLHPLQQCVRLVICLRLRFTHATTWRSRKLA